MDLPKLVRRPIIGLVPEQPEPFFVRDDGVAKVARMEQHEENKALCLAAIEGYKAFKDGKFPPRNPYAVCGITPDETGLNPKGDMWFVGYWHAAGEERV